jgi:DNA-binding beta-propeller fold protein YncE
VLGSIASLSSVTTAQTIYPLNLPGGLAVASNGNLYVANNGGNNILVYSPKHNELAGKTITQNISAPTAVAFDSYGNLWVANAGNSSITQYDSNGVQDSNNTILTGASVS